MGPRLTKAVITVTEKKQTMNETLIFFKIVPIKAFR